MSIKAWLFFLDRLALATGIVVALLTGMTGSATPEYSSKAQYRKSYISCIKPPRISGTEKIKILKIKKTHTCISFKKAYRGMCI